MKKKKEGSPQKGLVPVTKRATDVLPFLVSFKGKRTDKEKKFSNADASVTGVVTTRTITGKATFQAVANRGEEIQEVAFVSEGGIALVGKALAGTVRRRTKTVN